MLTVGRILSKARRKQGISLTDAEKETKIRRKYLKALEQDDFNSLPGRTYIIGFIKNYSEFLQIDTKRTLAIFRREFKGYKQPQILPNRLENSIEPTIFTITPRLAAIVASGAILMIFFIYLFLEYRFVALAPDLSLDNPLENQTVDSKIITVKGRSDPEAEVKINDQSVILQLDGTFSVDVTLIPGVNTITVVATNKFGKQAKISRTVEYEIP